MTRGPISAFGSVAGPEGTGQIEGGQRAVRAFEVEAQLGERDERLGTLARGGLVDARIVSHPENQQVVLGLAFSEGGLTPLGIIKAYCSRPSQDV